MLEDPKAVRIIKNLQIYLWGNKFLFSGSLRKRCSGGLLPTALEHHYPVIPTLILNTKFSSYILPLQNFIKLFISLQSNIISHEFWKKLWTYSEIFGWNSILWKWMFSRSLSNTFKLFRIKFIDPLQYINRLSVRGDL